MLEPYRVLDLTDERGALGPMILADLGADVTLIEPSGGAPSRSVDGGLPFHAFNGNKRSVTLDLDGPDGAAAFRSLVATAHFLFENAPPGAMAARGIDYDVLHSLNPELIYVSITPFGQDGPYAEHAATDLTLAAMGGMLALNGDSDRPPVRISVPQCWRHAAAESAVAALVAHFRRLQTGEGAHVDVSVQTATFWTRLNASIAAEIQGSDFERDGTVMQLATVSLQTMYPCKDGSIVFLVNRQSLGVVVPLLVEAGIVPESWFDEDWATYDIRLITGQPLLHSQKELEAAIAAYTRTHSKADLFRRGCEAGMFLAPSNDIADVLVSEQLHARDYWQPLTMTTGRVVQRLGPFVRAGQTPIAYRRGVPQPGADTTAVLNELDASTREVTP